MANTATIYESGEDLILDLDPASGSFGATLTADEAEMPNIAITASGGAVSVIGYEIPDAYPRLVGTKARAWLWLSRSIHRGETVTIDIPAFVSDGTRDNATSTGLAVSNESYVGTVADDCDDDTPIAYVDPLTQVAGTPKVYYRTDSEVGTDPAHPDGVVIPYRTIPAALAAVRGTGDFTTNAPAVHGVVLIARGQTYDGEIHKVMSSGVFANIPGESQAKPFVVDAWGVGDRPIIDPNALNALSSIRSVYFQGNEQFNIFRNLELRLGRRAANNQYNPAVFFRSRQGSELTGTLFQNCHIDSVTWGHVSSSTSQFTRSRTAFHNCTFGREITFNNTTPNGGVWSCDAAWAVFPYREIMVRGESSLGGVGLGSQFHGLYIKNMQDVVGTNIHFHDLSGTAMKFDGCHRYHFHHLVLTQCGGVCNHETNGEFDAGAQTDRTENSPGAYGYQGRVEKFVCTDYQTGRNLNVNQGVAFRGSTDCGVYDFLLVADGSVTQGNTTISYADGAGSELHLYARDSFRNTVKRGLIVQAAGSTTRMRGVGLAVATTDDFSVDGSKGQHEFNIEGVSIYRAAGASTVGEFVEILYDEYADGKGLGRVDGTISDINTYSEVSISDEFIDNGSSLDAAGFATEMDGDATNLRGDDPGIVDPTYRVSSFATSLGYTLAEFNAARREAIGQGAITNPLTVASIHRAVLPNFDQASLDPADFTTFPSFVDWTATEPVTGSPSILVVGLPSGSEYTFGEQNESSTKLSATFTIVNNGDATATLGTLAASGDLTISGSDNPSSLTIAAGATRTVTVLLDREVGGASGTLTIPATGLPDYTVLVTAIVRTGSLSIVDPNSGETTAGRSFTAFRGQDVRGSFKVQNTGNGLSKSIVFNEPTGLTITSSTPLTLASGVTRQINYTLDTSDIVTSEARVLEIEQHGLDPIEYTATLTVVERGAMVWYVRPGSTGGDGSETAPYASISELWAAHTHVPGDVIYVDTPDEPHLGTVTLTTIENLTIQRWPGKDRPKFRNVALIEFPDVYDSTGTYDILATSEATYGSDPTELIQDPEVHDANGLKCQGDGAGFLVAAVGANFAAKITAMKAAVGQWARDSGKLYISVPKGDRNADHQWYRALTGMLIQTSGACSDIVLDGLDLAYACDTSGTQKGNLVDVAGNISGLTITDCDIQVAYYHHVVTRGNETDNVNIDGNFFGVVRGENDGICTLYAGVTFGTGNEIKNNTCYGYVWRDTNGNTYKVNNGVVKGFGHHHLGDEVAAGSLKVYNNIFRKDPDVTTAQHQAWSVSAGGCNHAIPASISDFSQYAVQVYDNDFEGGIVNGASSSGSEICVAFRRNLCWGDFTGVADQTGMAGIGHITNNAGGGASKTRGLYEACVFSYNLADVSARSVFSLTDSSATVGTSDAQAYCINCTFYNQRTSTPTNANYLVNNASNGDGLTVTQSLLDAGYAIVPIGGNEGVASQTWTRNWYSSGMSNTMHAPTGTNRTTWASTYDTVGKYTDNPAFVDAETGEPDATTRAFKSGGTTGPDGINTGVLGGRYDQTFGAWQYGRATVGGGVRGAGLRGVRAVRETR